MVPESRLEPTEHGLAPIGDGWFTLNARDARWFHAPGRSALCQFEGAFEGEQDFLQFGVNLSVLEPGMPMAMYHWEADQEDFLVLAGQAVLLVEGEERPLRQWDFVHCPAGTKHVIVGAGDAPCVVLAVGASRRSTGADWGRLQRRRSRASPRRGSRAGDDRGGSGLHGAHQAQARSVPRRLAAGLPLAASLGRVSEVMTRASASTVVPEEWRVPW